MENRGRGGRGCPQENSQPPLVFDPQTFREAIGAVVDIIVQASVVAATIAQTSAMVGQGGTSNLRGFHHPPTYMGGGDSIIKTALAIEREIDDTRSIQGMGASAKRKDNQSSSSSRKKQKTSASYGFQGRAAAIRAKAESGLLARRGR